MKRSTQKHKKGTAFQPRPSELRHIGRLREAARRRDAKLAAKQYRRQLEQKAKRLLG